MKSIFFMLLVSLGITACQEKEPSEVTTSNEKPHINQSAVANGENSVAINSTGNVTIKEDNHGQSLAINSQGNVIIGKGNIVMNFPNDSISSQVSDTIILKPSGKTIRIPTSLRTNYTFNSTIDIEQACGNDDYLEVDENIAPYIDKNALKIGVIKLLNNSYQSSDNLKIKLITHKPLLSANTNGVGQVSLYCLSSDSFTLVDNAVGAKYLKNVQTKIFNLEFNGVGKIVFKNAQIDDFHVEKNAVGALDVFGHIENLDITNNGVGITTIEQATNSKINNFGVGAIKVKSDTNILKINSQALGNVVIHNN